MKNLGRSIFHVAKMSQKHCHTLHLNKALQIGNYKEREAIQKTWTKFGFQKSESGLANLLNVCISRSVSVQAQAREDNSQ